MIMVDTESGSIELGCRLAFFGCAFDFAATGGSGTHLRREMHTCICIYIIPWYYMGIQIIHSMHAINQ